jgi:hypothetical protein
MLCWTIARFSDGTAGNKNHSGKGRKNEPLSIGNDDYLGFFEI